MDDSLGDVKGTSLGDLGDLGDRGDSTVFAFFPNAGPDPIPKVAPAFTSGACCWPFPTVMLAVKPPLPLSCLASSFRGDAGEAVFSFGDARAAVLSFGEERVAVKPPLPLSCLG